MSDETMLFSRNEEQDGAPSEVHDTSTEKFLIFLSNGLYYGVSADYVKEIISEVSITTLPKMPSHVCGVFNLRGQIVPVVDFRRLLGQEPGEDSCAIVLDMEGTQIGILTDFVDRMVDVKKELILPVPVQAAYGSQKMVTGMCSLPNDTGTMMVVDFSQLMHEQ